jgi:hypothetical protein
MVITNASAEITLSVAEITARIRLMSDADKIRFIRASNYSSFGGARSPVDLRQEAIRRAIAGTRKCPSQVSILTFLKGAMRSIASADRKATAHGPKLAVVPSDSTAMQGLTDGLDPRLSAEDRMVQQDQVDEIRARILGLFDDDPTAQMIAEGMMDEMEGTELRELVGLSEKEFASKRRLVRRRIDNALPNGWKP